MEDKNIIKLKLYVFIIMGISVLSLILSIINLVNGNNVGRYRLYKISNNGAHYLFDTKTSRLFLRFEESSEGEAKYIDLGTIKYPIEHFKAAKRA